MRGINPLLTELRRRKVLRSALLYAVIAWVVVEVAATVFPLLQLPEWTPTLVLALAILGFPLMLVLAWTYDVTAAGVVQTGPVAELPATAVVAAPPVARSIAVLPFVDMSEAHDQEHFSDGIAEEILNVLARLRNLRVAARTSAFAFKGKNENVRRIGEELGVATVLEGSVRKAGNRIRITAQLIDVANGYHLWSERFDREAGDVFAIQDEIAASIVKALDLAIGCDAGLCVVAATDNVQAYEFYLRGRQHFHGLTQDGISEAREMFARAIRLDEGYAAAHAGCAHAAFFLYTWKHDPKHLADADVHSRRAVDLAPDLVESHTARGLALTIARRYSEAHQEFDVALELDPLSADTHYFYARSWWAAGDLLGAEKHFRRAAELRPEDYQPLPMLVSVYNALGRREAAQSAAAEGLERINRQLALNPYDVRAWHLGALCLAELGRADEARTWTERSISPDPEDATSHYGAACVYAKLREPERAFAELTLAMDRGWSFPEWLINDGDWGALREDPRFTSAVARLRADSLPKTAEQLTGNS